jgi:hypothetical protein
MLRLVGRLGRSINGPEVLPICSWTLPSSFLPFAHTPYTSCSIITRDRIAMNAAPLESTCSFPICWVSTTTKNYSPSTRHRPLPYSSYMSVGLFHDGNS